MKQRKGSKNISGQFSFMFKMWNKKQNRVNRGNRNKKEYLSKVSVATHTVGSENSILFSKWSERRRGEKQREILFNIQKKAM